MRPLASGLLALSLLVTGAPTEAQEGQRGWIGISYETRSTRDGAARVVITEVRRGSPAESAGVRPGDRLVAIEAYSSADDLMNLSRRLTLRPGQLIEMRIERDGRPRDLHLRAAERPFASYTDAAIAVSIQADSLVETMFRAMDSLRIHITEANGRSDRTVRTVSRSLESAAQARAATARSREAVSAPIEFFVFRGEQHDTLVRAMDDLNAAMDALRGRERDIQRARRGRENPDRELGEVRRALEELTRESATLRSAMAESARATAGWQYLLPPTPQAAPQPPTPRTEPYRPLTPYLLGSNRVAGAQVIDLQPELGAYFGVDAGVLVIDVSPGTPAAIAGLRPGDVVTRLDQVGVRTVEDLRFGVAQAGDTLPMTLIRQGASRQILLRRR
jgi:hypothetical protein